MTAVGLHCEPAGDLGAPPLLLGSSLGTTAAMWAPQVQALAGAHALYAFDHRGHGRSPAPAGPYTIAELGADVLALMDRLGLDRVAYCGLSLGGMVGQWLLANAPQRITAAVLISTGAHLPPADTWTERASTVRAAGGPEPIADMIVGRWFTPGYARAHPEVVARHRAMIAATPAEGYAGCCEAIGAMDLRAGLPGGTVPTLVSAGGQDPSIPPAHGRGIAAAIPGARYEELTPAAHLASVERAAEVSALIAEHLETHR